MTETVRLLTVEDAAAWFDLRQEMLVDTPHSFLASPSDDSTSTVEEVRERLSQAPDNVIVGAFTDDALVGSVGLFREAREKTRHRAWIWGVYLTPSARGRGLGVQMMEQAAAHGRTLDGVCQVCLSVSAMAPDAQKLYERVGFRAWGKEPRAMCVGGQLLDEVHMILPFGE